MISTCVRLFSVVRDYREAIWGFENPRRWLLQSQGLHSMRHDRSRCGNPSRGQAWR